jgi:hypothetical protein
MKDALLAICPGPSARALRSERAECYEHTPRFDDPAVESNFLHVAICRVPVRRGEQCTKTCAHSCIIDSDFRSTRQRDFSKLNAMKTNYLTFSLTLLFGLMSLLPVAKAVVPPPDGGYPGFTTAEGTNALKNLTTGIANTATGWYSLFTNSSGNYNTSVGAGALIFNNGEQKHGYWCCGSFKQYHGSR